MITDSNKYCYRVKPFMLKNNGATYQKLVTSMFPQHMGKTMEVNIDDMVAKSLSKVDHIGNLEEAFMVLRGYKMKLNPSKCTFRIPTKKFLGFIITQIEIEACP